MKCAQVVLIGIVFGLVRAPAEAEYRTVLLRIQQDKDQKSAVTIDSDEMKERRTAVSVETAVTALHQMEGSGSLIGVYVVAGPGVPRMDLGKLFKAISENGKLELAYFGHAVPKEIEAHFLKAAASSKKQPWAGEPTASSRWSSGGKLSTFKRLLKADDVTAVRITGWGNRTPIRLSVANFSAVLNSMRPVLADDPKYKNWSYADWYATSFETPEGQFQVHFYLGGLAVMRAPDGSVGLVVYEPPPASPNAAEGKPLVEKLQGAWTTVKATKNGTERKQEQGVELDFKGEEVIIRTPGQEAIIMNVKAPSPRGSIAFWTSPRKGAAVQRTETALAYTYALVKLEGDSLTLCIKSAFTLPSDFSDKDQVLWVLQRKR